MKVISDEYLRKFDLLVVKNQAEKGVWGGKDLTDYFQECRFFIPRFNCTLIFTRETGYHSSGWWKNPDFERCYHLSISFKEGRNESILKKILISVFGNNLKNLLVEAPYSSEGKKNEVWHYRMFCDVLWQPIVPRGEVYSTLNTETNWKSFSEVHKI